MSSAADSLGLSTATISRRLAQCAEDVGQTLFVRRGQTWEPTPAALVFVGLAESLNEGFPNGNQLSKNDEVEQRVIRASMPIDICMDAVAPQVTEFLGENDRLTLDVYHEPKSVAYGEVDIRVSYEEPTEGRLVRLRLGAIGYNTYVSKKHNRDPNGWVEVVDFERKPIETGHNLKEQFGAPRMRSGSLSCALDLIREMPLILNLPTNLAKRQEDLREWKSDAPTTYFPVWATYHESRRLDPDVRLMLGYLKSCFAA